MAVDVMIVGAAHEIACDPTDETMDLLNDLFNDYVMRYGYVELREKHVEALRNRSLDPVAQMLLKEVDSQRRRGVRGAYPIELMISV